MSRWCEQVPVEHWGYNPDARSGGRIPFAVAVIYTPRRAVLVKGAWHEFGELALDKGQRHGILTAAQAGPPCQFFHPYQAALVTGLK